MDASSTCSMTSVARQLIESGQELFLPKTVALELELLQPSVVVPTAR